MRWTKKSKVRDKAPTLSELITEMFWYFEGFEYDDTVVRISRPDYVKYTKEITVRKGQAYIGPIPVYIDLSMKAGKIMLENIHKVLKEKAA